MVQSKSQIAFEELGLGSLLRRYRLRVPPNQREYSWTEREVTQLLQDFARSVNEDGPYFLGTVVTIPRGEGTLEVVDGQQRLATTAIMLTAIRDFLRERGEELIVQSIDSEFLSGIDREERQSVPKLSLNIDDNELFAQIVTNGPGADEPLPSRASHGLLLEARNETRKQVQNIVAPFDAKEHADQLNRWVSFIEHRALVVLLRVPNDADAYKMFETLNDRGLRTSQADLIKNFLFSRSKERIQEVQNRWSWMRGALESASDDPDVTINFLRYALIVQRGHVREADVYDEVQNLVKSEQAAVAFAATLEGLANVFVATFNPDNERWNSYPDAARRAIEVLNLIDIKPMRSLILAISARMQPNEAALALRFLIALGVRLMIASRTRSGSVEVPISVAARDVHEGKIETAAELSDALSGLTPSDAEFRTAFERARVSNTKLARYYLRSLEMTAKGEAEPWFVPQGDQQVINLEHVLPKKPEDSWPQFQEDEVRQLTTRLGNLALLRSSDNSELRSQGFAFKKPIYARSPYVLTSQIAEADDWTSETIDARQVRLAALALTTWPGKAPGSGKNKTKREPRQMDLNETAQSVVAKLTE